MISIRGLLLISCSICHCISTDGTDMVQMAVGSNQLQNLSTTQKCNDDADGFINFGVDVEGNRKLCPDDYPYVDTTKSCAKKPCTVVADRYTCCRKATCTCPHGKTTTAEDTDPKKTCEKDQTVDCYECDKGYHMSTAAGPGAQSCTENKCHCKNGEKTLASGNTDETRCENDDEADCSKCHEGYRMSGTAGKGSQTCIKNTCKCSNGKANGQYLSTVCVKHDEENCANCDDGFTLTPAGQNRQTCEPNTCRDRSQLATLTSNHDQSACVGTLKTAESCTVSCANGYVGQSQDYKCDKDGQIKGTAPTCTAITCSVLATVFTKNSLTDCDKKGSDKKGTLQANDKCTGWCEKGYEGKNQSYVCKKDADTDKWSFEGTDMDCKPKSCILDPKTAPPKGNYNDCTSPLESDGKCALNCQAGYSVHGGKLECSHGELTNKPECKPDPCAVTAPEYGTMGNCTDSLKSGHKCKPECANGYTAEPPLASCTEGNLIMTTCKFKLQCKLVFEKMIGDNHGYWTTQEQYLDYDGCENFCNLKNTALQGVKDKKINGCELYGVTSKDRDSKGQWCFAHVADGDLEVDTSKTMAAAKCEEYGGPK